MLSSISHYIDAFNNALGKTIAYATIFMAIITFAVVVLRYGFNLGWIGMQESVTYLHAAVFLLGSAFTYQQDGHVRVDVFYRRFNARNRAIVNLLGCTFFLLPVCIYISVICWHYVIESWQLMETSREPGGLPFIYILKSFLLVFSFTMTLQAISEILKHLIYLIKGKQLKQAQSDTNLTQAKAHKTTHTENGDLQ